MVFEPNDQALWAKIRRTIAAFLVMEWRAGALFGATPDEAFYVKCDSETNPAEGIDAGQVVCEIGVAPGQAGRVRDLPPGAVLRRHQPRQRVVPPPPMSHSSGTKGSDHGTSHGDRAVGHSFGLEFDGITIKAITEVSGLKIEQDVVEYKENGPDGKYQSSAGCPAGPRRPTSP